ncbi:MAG TPA: DNA-formamidopyrimidine glycosylase [Candidatus Enterococcus avicola]|uniref:Formamidopyrimidine-DNA glycosylase n=1 Tax=Candidatus Enterococcus avicola TaxID=2838561 RepID=A0A9D2F901_9ENTE|nr:DNA-formamidopyrimidine glycosylase [Candidatus Enterococcus avicola]
MPELPEVETVRKGLQQLVLGKTIAKVEVFWPRIIEMPEVPIFQEYLIGQTIEAMSRRGKFLIFKLSQFDLVSHLRMEGKYEFFARDQEVVITKHTHVIFHFTDGSQLQYRDVRKFGRMALVGKDQSSEYRGIKQLGPEPLSTDFKLEAFEKALALKTMAIKPLLLNQKIVVGLGNIYVDEALWYAKIHPERPANSLTKEEIGLLYEGTIKVLGNAVEAGGTTIRSYVNALGEMGEFQVSLVVYDQTGKSCPRCQTPIEKIKVAQRGTHFCPTCQKKVGG